MNIASFSRNRLSHSLLGVLWTILAQVSYASSWSVQTGGSGDNVGLYDARESATWYSDGTRWGYPQVRLSYHRLACPSLVGIPGGSRQDVGTEGLWITAVKGVKLTGGLGLDVLQEPTSWRAEAEADWNTGVLWNMRTTAKASSGWMEGWLTRQVRSSTGSASVGWDGPLTWAEIGAQVEERTGGVQPQCQLPIEIPNDRITTAWAWGTRRWLPWLQAGLAAHVSNSTAETHQPVGTVNDTLQWIDIPYGTPHDEAAVGGLLRLSAGPAYLGTAWPLWSTNRQRVEKVYAWDTDYWYTLNNTAMAEVTAGGNFVAFQKYACGLEAKALSLPYKSNAWFTKDAWNQYGLNFTVRFSTL